MSTFDQSIRCVSSIAELDERVEQSTMLFEVIALRRPEINDV